MKPDQIRGWTFKLYSQHEKINSEKKLQLKRPQISIEDLADQVLGTWSRENRLITISLKVIEEGTYDDVLQVLKHEMAHQFVDEVLERKDNRPHGELFKMACQSLGIDSSASFKIGHKKDKHLAKIQKLLALSSSMNQYEAEAALAKAQELSFKYNVGLTEHSENRFNVRPLGGIRKRIPSFEWKVMNILSEFYFVQTLKTYHQSDSNEPALWQFEIYGTSHNIDTAEYVYYFLMNNAEALWKSYRLEYGSSVSRKRNSFMNGLFDGFCEKLRVEQTALKKKFQIVRLLNPELNSFFEKCNPRVSRRKVSFSAEADVYKDGLAEGRNLKINPAIKKNKSANRALFLTDKSL